MNGSTATYPGNPQSFLSGSPMTAPWTFNFTFTMPGTYQYQCDLHVGAGMTGTITVVEPSSYPEYDIATVTTVDADGVLDSLGVVCQLQGIVYGVDFRGGTGVQFMMRDNTGGIAVFSTTYNSYNVTEGDEIIVQGTIEQFSGLSEIAPDMILFVSAGNTLEDPTVVTSFDESTEGELVRINGVHLVDPGQWTGSGPGFNVDLTDDVNNYSVRIDNDCTLYGTAAPGGTFDLIGLGWQFDNATPFTEGYQIYPRYTDDLIGGIINPTQYPPYDIGVVTTVDGNGDVDSLNVKCQLQGLVTSGDFNGGGSIQFFLDDGTGGVSVFSSNPFGYTVNENDEIIVRGTIVTFSCLTQVDPDTLWLVSSGNTPYTPEVVIGPMTEAHEGELLQFNNLNLVDPGQWTGAGPGFNVEVTDGVNNYQMRIDNDVDLYSLPAPTGTFNAIGLGSQFDSDGTCNSGYQFLPRSLEDIISTGVHDRVVDLQLRLYPNPAGERLFVQTEATVESWIIFDLFGKQLLQWEGMPSNGFDISSLQTGMYLLQARVEGGVASRKFVVE
ncbi:MAG: T9SS type A sorting domain-containing protein [Saprospirales bacterium]|nr:T9SS type A sorting domain-containing protein [Saprospirales bacterium]